MKIQMRQVTQEEFEILTRFHPGEVRYYVDTNSAINRRKGVTTSPKVKKKRAVSKRLGTNRPIQLGLSAPAFREGTKALNMWRLVKLKFERDPTKVIGRTELVSDIVDTSVYPENNIGPFVSDCLKRGVLRYTGV